MVNYFNGWNPIVRLKYFSTQAKCISANLLMIKFPVFKLRQQQVRFRPKKQPKPHQLREIQGLKKMHIINTKVQFSIIDRPQSPEAV